MPWNVQVLPDKQLFIYFLMVLLYTHTRLTNPWKVRTEDKRMVFSYFFFSIIHYHRGAGVNWWSLQIRFKPKSSRHLECQFNRSYFKRKRPVCRCCEHWVSVSLFSLTQSEPHSHPLPITEQTKCIYLHPSWTSCPHATCNLEVLSTLHGLKHFSLVYR